jgi:hypothetical protein
VDKLPLVNGTEGQFNNTFIDATSSKCPLQVPYNDQNKHITTEMSSKQNFVHSSDMSDVQPPDYHEVVTANCGVKTPNPSFSDKEQVITNSPHVDVSRQCRVKPVAAAAASIYSTRSLPISHRSPYNVIAVGQTGRTHIPVDLGLTDAPQFTQQVTSLPRQLHHPDAVPVVGPVTRTFGHAGVITVTPLTARRMRTMTAAPDAAIVVNAAHSRQMWNNDVKMQDRPDMSNLGDQAVESKATVYDNVLNVNI